MILKLKIIYQEDSTGKKKWCFHSGIFEFWILEL